ncbi:HTH_Tnp_Tc3_2 domain-containing protein [Trichonephila clavipes]|nr:HTH_Tnp_Tc3_2 domain-containing protein [Trichonephila clavipes]
MQFLTCSHKNAEITIRIIKTQLSRKVTHKQIAALWHQRKLYRSQMWRMRVSANLKRKRDGTGSGRPRSTTERKNRPIQRTAVAYRTASAAEIRATVGNAVTQQTVTSVRFLQGQHRARHHVACIPMTPSHCRLRCQWCQARAHWRTEWEYVVFFDESMFCLVAIDDRVLIKRRPENACNQTVSGLDTLDLYLMSWSGEQFPMTPGTFS